MALTARRGALDEVKTGRMRVADFGTHIAPSQVACHFPTLLDLGRLVYEQASLCYTNGTALDSIVQHAQAYCELESNRYAH